MLLLFCVPKNRWHKPERARQTVGLGYWAGQERTVLAWCGTPAYCPWRFAYRRTIRRLAPEPRYCPPHLAGEQSVALRADPVVEHAGNAGTGREARQSVALDLPEDRLVLFEALRKWRREEAREQEIPPYVIFHDSVLKDIALEKPEDMDALGDIKGVGRSKLERYGEAVLAVLEAV